MRRIIVVLICCLPVVATAQDRNGGAPRSHPNPSLNLDPLHSGGGQPQGSSDGNSSNGVSPGNPLDDLHTKLAKLSLADFQYAAAMAHATNNQVTAPCWDAWVTLLEAQQQPLKDAQGNALTEPNPHVITDVEKLAEFVNQLQPNSPISLGCGALASAAQKTVGNLIGAVLSGGALGLFKLPIPIP